jgi:hypothetical protein
LLLFGLRLAGAASVSLWLSFEVAATALLGALWFRDRLGARGVLGVAVRGRGGGAVLGAARAASGLAAAASCSRRARAGGSTTTHRADRRHRGRRRARSGRGSPRAAREPRDRPPRARRCADVRARALAALGVGCALYGASIALLVSASQALGATRAQSLFASAPFFGALLAMAVPRRIAGCATPRGALGIRRGRRAARARPPRHTPTRTRRSEHEHAHRHDDGHHDHAHAGQPRSLWHSHRHRHAPLRHAHPHWPDLHHRHEHED